jgi:hypothetical protein
MATVKTIKSALKEPVFIEVGIRITSWRNKKKIIIILLHYHKGLRARGFFCPWSHRVYKSLFSHLFLSRYLSKPICVKPYGRI